MARGDRYQRLLSRRAPTQDRQLARFSESYEGVSGSTTKYLVGAMAPVNAKLTQRLIEQGDRVEQQLTERLAHNYPLVEFRRQGSVSNFTHIRYFSDVDVLAIIDKFFTLEPPQEARPPYQGNPLDDLLVLRQHCVAHLKSAYPSAVVNDSGSTSIALSGGSLACAVDVVPANWYNTTAYSAGGGDHTRGVMVLNRDEMTRVTNYPFLFNHRLDLHDRARNGVPRMLVRLLKTESADYQEDNSVNFALSSFDICSLVYRMPDSHLNVPMNEPLKIIFGLLTWMYQLIEQPGLRGSLKVIDDSRLIFDEEIKVQNLGTLFTEVATDYHSANQEHGGAVYLTEAHRG